MFRKLLVIIFLTFLSSSQAWAIDYYETLGVHPDATAEEIKTAWRKLIQIYHPDIAPPGLEKEYEEQAKSINEAYQTLSDLEKRKRYDASVKVDSVPQAPVAAMSPRQYFDRTFAKIVRENVSNELLQTLHAQADRIREQLTSTDQVTVAINMLSLEIRVGEVIDGWIEELLETSMSVASTSSLAWMSSTLEFCPSKLGPQRVRDFFGLASQVKTSEDARHFSEVGHYVVNHARNHANFLSAPKWDPGSIFESEMNAYFSSQRNALQARAFEALQSLTYRKTDALHYRFAIGKEDSSRLPFIRQIPNIQSESQARFFEIILEFASESPNSWGLSFANTDKEKQRPPHPNQSSYARYSQNALRSDTLIARSIAELSFVSEKTDLVQFKESLYYAHKNSHLNAVVKAARPKGFSCDYLLGKINGFLK